MDPIAKYPPWKVGDMNTFLLQYQLIHSPNPKNGQKEGVPNLGFNTPKVGENTELAVFSIHDLHFKCTSKNSKMLEKTWNEVKDAMWTWTKKKHLKKLKMKFKNRKMYKIIKKTYKIAVYGVLPKKVHFWYVNLVKQRVVYITLNSIIDLWTLKRRNWVGRPLPRFYH